jgi:hypothetical protein
MPSQKIPLFNGMIIPIHNGSSGAVPATPPIPTIVASPLDKALKPEGVRATYEVHLWLKPGAGVLASPSDYYFLYAYLDNDPATKILVWAAQQATFPVPLNGPPVKILDGYPVRGNVTLALETDIPAMGYAGGDAYPTGAQVFGHYFRVGQGSQIQPERRFIGDASPDGITSGVPLVLAAEERKILHVFEDNRIDEITLGFAQDSVLDTEGFINITFEDENNNLIIPGQEINMGFVASPNFLRDPQSVYSIYQVPFGGGFIPNLHHIAVTNLKDDRAAFVHGYFTRR